MNAPFTLPEIANGSFSSAPRIKTPSEQRLEWLEGLKRPLTDDESRELQRALHAVYCRNRKLAA